MTSDIASSKVRAIPHAFRELLLLEEVQRSVEGRSDEQQARVREVAEAVDARIAAAETLSAADQVPPALTLLFDATLLAIQGVLEAHGTATASTPQAAWTALASLIESGALPPPPPGFDNARALATNPRHLAFDELSDSEGIERRGEIEAILVWLRNRIEPRSLAQVKRSRRARVGALVLIAAGGIIGGIAWGALKLISPKNIALHAAVQMSSRRPNCPASSGPTGAPPSGLVDGSKSGSYDICTNYEVHPWVTIELSSSQPLSKIKVYGRGDCCWGQYDLPTLLEVSDNGVDYAEVDRRTTAYSASDPWVATVGGKRAKFIRLRADSAEQRELVLNEIEVFAAK